MASIGDPQDIGLVKARGASLKCDGKACMLGVFAVVETNPPRPGLKVSRRTAGAYRADLPPLTQPGPAN
jgi:hypothetical protein